MKTVDELRKLDLKKLMAELEEARKERFKITFDVRGGNSKNSHLISKNRKYVARVKTIIRQKEVEPTIQQSEEVAAAA
jgi:large subunit ribosomal protein L29